MAEEENVKVAVRVRPFNKREKSRNAKLIVQMKGNVTNLTNPEDPNDINNFTYDFSYWSFDGCKEFDDGYFGPDPSHPNNKQFADQKRVFNDLGEGILKNAWAGFNSTLFAYGQTGSGKSWSVIGYGTNKGIVPMFCEAIFKGMKEKLDTGEKMQFEVKFSMLEIYNEVVHDLLSAEKSKKGLRIRQNPKKGFYAEGLKTTMVTSYDEIEQKMEEGTVNRTVASTNMNATSSRAHTIVGITFIQKFKNSAGQETAKSAVINLVDLAGSERVESTGATGERLKEGAAINQSLSCLGNCIHALAENSSGKKTRVPFRDSSLTKLLANALGGNSKTVMIAALSPADINYEETLSTLRYADRAKQIKTKAIVNEDPTEKMLRELKEENDRLKKMMASGQLDMSEFTADGDMSDEEIAELKKQWEEETRARMMENEKEMLDMKRSYEEKLKQAEMERGDPTLSKINQERKTKPHIVNLNMDPQLSGRIVHIVKKGNTEIGNRKGHSSEITMVGPSIQSQHGIFSFDEKKNIVNIKPFNSECRILVNGSLVTGDTTLCHNDRLVFGTTQMWVYQNPKERDSSGRKYPDVTYEYAQEEIAAKAGIDMNQDGSADIALVQEDLLEVMPAVEEANSISGELDKRVKFELFLVSPQVTRDTGGKTEGAPEICVKMKNLENGTEFVWPKDKFMNRLYMMKEMYDNFEDDEDDWDRPEEEDPFQEDINTEVDIGTVQAILNPLSYMIEMKEQLEIYNVKGQDIGLMNLEIVPCDRNGKEFTEEDDMFVESPEMLLGKEVHFKFKILNCRGIPNKYEDICCSFNMYLDQNETCTKRTPHTTNPDFNFEKVFSFKPVTQQFLDYLCNKTLLIKIKGKQHIRKSALPRTKGLTTKDMLKSDRTIFSKTANLMNGFQMNGRVIDPQKQSVIVELLLMKKTQARLQQRVDSMKKLLEKAEQLNRQRVSTELLKKMMSANTPEQVEKVLVQLEGK